MPLAGGELARAALEYGFESYGIDILMRYYDMISKQGETYLWYFPDGRPSTVETSTSPEAKPTDGWGSSAMLYAFIEGLVGIQDKDKLFRRIRLCPRWEAAAVEKADVNITYKSSGASVSYKYNRTADGISIRLKGDYEYIQLSLLIPANSIPGELLIGGKKRKFIMASINSSNYLTADADVKGDCEIILKLNKTP
jgi:hypothetical protein